MTAQGEAKPGDRQCAKTKDDGTRCPNPALPASIYCAAHQEGPAKRRPAGGLTGPIRKRYIR